MVDMCVHRVECGQTETVNLRQKDALIWWLSIIRALDKIMWRPFSPVHHVFHGSTEDTSGDGSLGFHTICRISDAPLMPMVIPLVFVIVQSFFFPIV